MRLFAKVSDPELLLRSLNEMGTAFYRPVKGEIVEAVYFSASRAIYFLGKLNREQYEVLKSQAHPAKRFRLNGQREIIEVDQFEDEN